MSTLEPRTIDPDTLPEPRRFEIMRLDALDSRHAVAHRKAGMMDLCATCRTIGHQMETLADGGDTEMATAVDRLARGLATLAPGDEGAWDGYSRAGRDVFRRRAVKLITLLDGLLGFALTVSVDIPPKG